MIAASDSTVGQKYKTPHGILIEIIEIRPSDVVVKSFETGHHPYTFDIQINTCGRCRINAVASCRNNGGEDNV